MKPLDPIVFVVDDDRGICEAVADLLSTFDLQVVAFGSVGEYLAYPKPDVPTCLVLDVELPDANGLDLQGQTGHPHPHIVFITGHGDIPKSVRAMKAGAVDFLTKPLNESELIGAIRAAITQDRIARRERTELVELHRRLSCLTPREREVLPLVVSGLLNKQAAAELGISEITIQIHRGKIMKKNLKKLALHRETLRALEEGAIREAVGGATARTCGSPCSAACTIYPCVAASDACSFAPNCTK